MKEEEKLEKEELISVKDVSKVYRLYDRAIDRLLESVSIRKKSYHKDFFALRDISFSVKKGEAVGIIGTNGSGKSTMLKIITGVLTPTGGTVETRGSICALLELGAGFNQDYTGIENIYMNGTMMGISKEEMDKKLPDILDFADIGDFVNQPVKSYSSGMFVRLAFALYISIDPEILIVDEALSVGDVFFQAKCYHRMDELKKKGTTILMVTHDLGSVMKYCDRVILFNKGKKVGEGLPGEMVDQYKKILAGKNPDAEKFVEEQDFLGEGRANRREEASGTKESRKRQEGAPLSERERALSSGQEESGTTSSAPRLMKEEMAINPSAQLYGNGKAEIYDFGIFDHEGKLSNILVKGESFTIKERIRFHAAIAAPIFTFTIKDKRGMDLTGTNTLFEGENIPSVKAGDEYLCSFTQKMNLQGGEYLLSISCTGFEGGEHTVYDRKYDITSITVLSNKKTVGIYDMESKVTLERHEG